MFRRLLALCAALILTLASPTFSDDTAGETAALEKTTDAAAGNVFEIAEPPIDTSAINGIPIDSGGVVLRGQLMPPPYVIARSDGKVLVNSEIVAVATGNVARHQTARIERQLINGNWMMVFDADVIAFVDPEEGMTLVGELARANSIAESVKRIMSVELQGAETVTSAEWQTALLNFQPDESIVQEYSEYENEMESTDWISEDSEESLKVHDSTSTMYGLSVVGMLLIALSAGTLLGHPPKNSISWSRIVRSPRTLTAMQRCLVLIAAYSLFDLAATLLAVKTGHVEELNPFGVGLILAPAALAAFKVASTCLGTGLLWRLKNYHGAQVASWWLCMVLTLVTVRWVTVQSLFFV
jgi:hypothetical protein